jgi:hypothetical protein
MADLKYEDFLNKSLGATQSLIEENEKLKQSLGELAKMSEENIKKLNLDTSTKSYNEFNKELQNLEETEKQLQKLIENGISLSEKERTVKKELLKTEIKKREEKKKLVDEVKQELALQEKTIKSVDSLTKRNKALTKQINSLNLETAEGVEQYKALSVEIINNKDEIKKLDKEIKDTKKSQDAYNKSLKIETEIAQGLIKSKKELKEANKQLRLAVDGLNIDDQAADIERLNALIDANTNIIEENSDTQTKAKFNVGKYEESIRSFLESQDSLSKEMEIYNTIMGVATFLTKKNTKETEDNADAKDDLTKATEKAEQANEDLNNSFKKSIIGAIVTVLASLISAWSQTSEGAESFKVVLADIQSVISIVVNRVGALANFLIKDFKSAFLGAKKDILEFKATLLSAADSPFLKRIGISFDSVSGSLKATNEEVAQLDKQIKELDGQSAEDLERATNGFFETIKKAREENAKFIATEKEKLVLGRELQKTLTVERGLRERLSALRDAESVSLTERLAISESIRKIDQSIGENSIKVAKDELKLTNDTIRRKLIENNINQKFSDAEINNINNNAKLRKFVSSELLDQQTENLIELQDVENELLDNQIENNREINTLRLDAAELRFDNLEKFNEALLQQNLLIISNENLSLEAKLDAQRKIQEVNEKNFDAQISNIVEVQKQNRATELENLKLANASAAEIAKKKEQFLLEESDIKDLLNSKDSVAFADQIENLLLAERINASLADILLEQFNIKQEQLDVEKDINEEQRDQELLASEILILEKEILDTKRLNAELEKLLATDTTNFTIEEKERLRDEIKRIEDEITGIGETADDQRREAKIVSLKKELELTEEGSKRRLEIQKELLELELEGEDQKNEELIEGSQKVTKSLEDDGKTQKENLKNNLDSILDFIDGYLKERSKKEIEGIDKELSAVQKREATLLALIESGNAEAGASLSALRKEEALLEAEKEKEQEKQQNRELLIATLKSFNNGLSGGENSGEALINTIGSISQLTSFISSLPKFATGTDSFGTESVSSSYGTKIHSGIDGQLAMVNVGERILPTELNQKLGGISNETLVSTFTDAKSLPQSVVMQSVVSNAQGDKNDVQKAMKAQESSIVATKLDKLIKVMSNDSKFQFDEFENALIKSTTINNKTVNVKKRLKIRK